VRQVSWDPEDWGSIELMPLVDGTVTGSVDIH
jgi:hypothetical protein